jgi:hypothetical protein
VRLLSRASYVDELGVVHLQVRRLRDGEHVVDVLVGEVLADGEAD